MTAFCFIIVIGLITHFKFPPSYYNFPILIPISRLRVIPLSNISHIDDLTAEVTHEAAIKLAASRFVEGAVTIGARFDGRAAHILNFISPHKGNRQIPIVDIATDRITALISDATADSGPSANENLPRCIKETILSCRHRFH